jgi:hypothetical protein
VTTAAVNLLLCPCPAHKAASAHAMLIISMLVDNLTCQGGKVLSRSRGSF